MFIYSYSKSVPAGTAMTDPATGQSHVLPGVVDVTAEVEQAALAQGHTLSITGAKSDFHEDEANEMAMTPDGNEGHAGWFESRPARTGGFSWKLLADGRKHYTICNTSPTPQTIFGVVRQS